MRNMDSVDSFIREQQRYETQLNHWREIFLERAEAEWRALKDQLAHDVASLNGASLLRVGGKIEINSREVIESDSNLLQLDKRTLPAVEMDIRLSNTGRTIKLRWTIFSTLADSGLPGEDALILTLTFDDKIEIRDKDDRIRTRRAASLYILKPILEASPRY